MTDTPRSNELSPVVFMGSGDPDLTAPEQVERFGPYAVDGGCDAYGAMEDDPHGDWVKYSDYAALAAKLAEAERRNLNLRQIERNVQAERERQFNRAEKAEARERALLRSNDQERKALVENTSLRDRLKAADAERYALDAAWSERVALLEKTISEAEARIAELEAELGAYREMQAESNAQGGPSVIRLQMQARRDRIRAEKEAAKNALLREAVIEAMDMDCAAAAWTILRDTLVTLDKDRAP